MADQSIFVKLLCRNSRQGAEGNFLRQFPGGEPVWGRCRFIFDPDARQYDWLVAYEDLPKEGGTFRGRESLACAPEHTLLVTTEPSSIKQYGRRFVAQFGRVLTSQDAAALPHPGAVRSQPALLWYYGLSLAGGRHLDFDALRDHPPLAKSRALSIVTSAKQMRLTLHRRRFQFTQELRALVPELEVFGRGVRDIADKAEALTDYRYHVAVENFLGPHHWTEKLADSFLACALPFYFGCPNVADYFPADSFIPIDIFDPPGAARTIRAALAAGEYEKRLPLVLEARRRVMYEYNLFAVLSRLIEGWHAPGRAAAAGRVLLSRHALRAASPANMVADVWEKLVGRVNAFRLRR